jgi:hypothetical protein
MKRLLFLALLFGAGTLPAQDPGERDLLVRLSGEPAELLREALEHRYIILEAPPEGIELARDTTYTTTVIVVNGPVYVSSTVQGDVIAIGADLFMRPGAQISGRALAIGGSTHHSTMARAEGGLFSFRFLRVEVREVPAGFEVREAAPAHEAAPMVTLPGIYGLRIPGYNRVDGAAITWGPETALADGRLRFTPLLTYRSAPGAFDVSGHLRAEPSSRLAIELFGGRGTFTHDGWIQTDFANSLTTLVRGRDYRNYWRADRFEGRVIPVFVVGEVTLILGAGARTERAWSVPARDVWSITGASDMEGTGRPNPEILPGRITSALGTVGADWAGPGMTLQGQLQVETVVDAPDDLRFTQTILDGSATIPTFGFQSLTFRTRAMFTGGDPTPPQRYGYLGGAGTLPTFPILSMGGDRLFFLESMYHIPVDALVAGPLGSPTFSLRHVLGAAGVDHLPSLEQNIGVRVALGFVRADFMIEPVDRRTRFDLGLTFIR